MHLGNRMARADGGLNSAGKCWKPGQDGIVKSWVNGRVDEKRASRSRVAIIFLKVRGAPLADLPAVSVLTLGAYQVSRRPNRALECQY
jgi:hypothetical protein